MIKGRKNKKKKVKNNINKYHKEGISDKVFNIVSVTILVVHINGYVSMQSRTTLPSTQTVAKRVKMPGNSAKVLPTDFTTISICPRTNGINKIV